MSDPRRHPLDLAVVSVVSESVVAVSAVAVVVIVVVIVVVVMVIAVMVIVMAVSYTHLRAHETVLDLVCRLLLEKKILSYPTSNTT